MNCKNCGTELGHEAEYCMNCGAKQPKVRRFSAKNREQSIRNKSTLTGASANAPRTGRTSVPMVPIIVILAIVMFFSAVIINYNSLVRGFTLSSQKMFIEGYGEAHSKTASVVVAGLDAINVNATVGKKVTQVSFSISNAPDNITLPNDEAFYEYNGTITCDGQDKDAFMHVALLQDKGVNFVICNARFDNAELFETVTFSLPITIDGETVMHDAIVTVEDYRWIT